MNNDIKLIENRTKELIQKIEDSVKGFEKAAENANEKSNKQFFENRAKKRRLFVKSLHNATPALETGNTEIEGSAKGSLHRKWMDIKAFVTNNNDEALLEEAIRGDESAILDYNEMMAETMMPYRLKEILREQRDEIQNDIETSEVLEKFA